eukprot:TRINITY_DN2171_c0_g1_i1.p1 TRINITY_DN2171_c0_g1~~TRINITY_DN2171_c0_g1_i1.p1  ORF type:complete len:126 (+),score=8.56 TRINITY_DN2171_c0_g1_i1:349-726(+)
MEQIKPQKYNTAGMEDYLFFTWIQMLQEKLKTYRANRRSELLGIQFRLGGILESLKRRHLSHIFFRVRRDEPISYVCTKHLFKVLFPTKVITPFRSGLLFICLIKEMKLLFFLSRYKGNKYKHKA